MSDKTYKPDEVSVLVGAVIVTNFLSVTISLEEDKWAYEAGSGGEETRIKNSNKHGTITLELPQSTDVNLQLSSIAEADATVAVGVIDGSGNSIYAMPTGSINKIPDSVFGKNEANSREWVIGGRLAVNVVGGN